MRKRTLCNPNLEQGPLKEQTITKNEYDINKEPIVIPKPTIDLFLEQDKPGDLMALYQFYYYTAKWQRTNQARATTVYAADGLKWGQDRVRRIKKTLIELGLIEDVVKKDETGKIKGHYVKVKFIRSKTNTTLREIQSLENIGRHPPGNPESGNNQSLENQEGNALSTNNGNALSTNRETISKEIVTDSKKSNENSPDQKEESSSKKSPIIPRKTIYEIYSLRLIQYWCSFEHTTNHKLSTLLNITCQKMVKNLIALQKGVFGNGSRRLNSEWMKRNKIPENFISRAWTYMELREGIDNLSKYGIEGYWPEKGKENFKSLPSLIYNPRQHNSWLLVALVGPPKFLAETDRQQWENPFPETTEEILKSNVWPQGRKADVRKLVRGIQSLKEFSDNLIPDDYGKCQYWFGTLAKLLKEYLDWLREQDWLEVNESVFMTSGGVFKKFIEKQEREIKVEIRARK